MTWDHVQQIVAGLLGLIGAIGAILIKDILNKVSDLTEKLNDFQAEVPKVYVTKVDLEKDIDRIFHRFDKLEAKLDRLIDRNVKE